MLKTVVLAKNPFEPETWVTTEVEDVRAFLMSEFAEWPASGRIYYGNVSEANDITPHTEAEVERLGDLPGPFYVVIYPEGIEVIFYIIIAIVVIAAVVMQPSVPNPTLRNTQTASPNNELSKRTNSPRPLGRIPDIYGTVRSTPDLVSVPYSLFENHEEVEYAYMCIGRGTYDIFDIRDDTTPVGFIEGTTIELFAPNTSPTTNNPYHRIGEAINRPVMNVVRSNAINGQVLKAPNATYYSESGITAIYPNRISKYSDTDFRDFYEVGDVIQFNGIAPCTRTVQTGTTTDAENNVIPVYEAQPVNIDLSGTYVVGDIDNNNIWLSDWNKVGSNWPLLDEVDGKASGPFTPNIQISEYSYFIGPFDLDLANMSQIYANFVALNGLYHENSDGQYRIDINVRMQAQPINIDGSARGGVEQYNAVIVGSTVSKTTRAVSMGVNLASPGLYRVWFWRTTDTDRMFKGSVVDEVKVRDLYAAAPYPLHLTYGYAFGDVTTVHAKTRATAGALALKERKLNMLVTRRIESRNGDGTYSVRGTNYAGDIIRAVCLDPFIGNRQLGEIDLAGIYAIQAEITSYFGTYIAAHFSYTFDTDNLSFEETVQTIANAVHCLAYRRGNVIKLSFEKETTDSTLLFNHRNKLPGSETRTVSFGNSNDNDGIEYQYVDPKDDAVVTLYLPADRNSKNRKKIESVGIRSKLQAYFQAWRAWNKIRFSNQTVEFEATQEANLILPQDRILVADNTRSNTQDGDVVTQNGLELELTHDVTYDNGVSYTIFLQHADGSVEAIGITPGSAANKVILSAPPRNALALGDDLYARATYVIVGNNSNRQTAFLVTEKTPNDSFTSNVKAINYDARYYANDDDYKTGVVDANGNLI